MTGAEFKRDSVRVRKIFSKMGIGCDGSSDRDFDHVRSDQQSTGVSVSGGMSCPDSEATMKL
ncbi:hypothetical protein, partial [Mesorhizobium sp. M2E.F.Ca.ET.209.01.1.1]|uniref:hypothetical protein n=1 Tax=Mesorhizobium sp. M2E.F.Ca.ET.209.01.1.1 TaxID=2500526 RepID=UPI001AEF15CC